MSIHWHALLVVSAVSLGSTVAVVVLVTVALRGLSARAARTTATDLGVSPSLSPRTGTAVAAVCLTVAALIVLFGLWVLVVR